MAESVIRCLGRWIWPQRLCQSVGEETVSGPCVEVILGCLACSQLLSWLRCVVRPSTHPSSYFCTREEYLCWGFRYTQISEIRKPRIEVFSPVDESRFWEAYSRCDNVVIAYFVWGLGIITPFTRARRWSFWAKGCQSVARHCLLPQKRISPNFLSENENSSRLCSCNFTPQQSIFTDLGVFCDPHQSTDLPRDL